MKFLLPVIITAMALFAPLSSSVAEGQGNHQIKSIFFQKNNDTEVVQIRLSGKVLPKIFELGGEKPRVVLDFIETGYQPNKIRMIKAGGEMVSKIRVGLHTTPIAKTRVVIDMVEGMKYAYTKEYIAESTIFRISFTAPEDQKPEKKRVPKIQTHPVEKEVKQVPAVEQTEEEKSSSAQMEIQKNVEIKDTQKSEAAMNFSAKISEEPNVTEKKKDEIDAASGITIFEEKQQQDAKAASPRISKVKEEPPHILLNVRYEKSINGNEMVLFHLNGFYPPIVYSAESGELFVVCDFLDAELGPDHLPVNTKGGRYIRHIKVEASQQPKKVRVVVGLAENFAYDVKQVFFKEENLFVIVLNSLGEKNKTK